MKLARRNLINVVIFQAILYSRHYGDGQLSLKTFPWLICLMWFWLVTWDHAAGFMNAVKTPARGFFFAACENKTVCRTPIPDIVHFKVLAHLTFSVLFGWSGKVNFLQFCLVRSSLNGPITIKLMLVNKRNVNSQEGRFILEIDLIENSWFRNRNYRFPHNWRPCNQNNKVLAVNRLIHSHVCMFACLHISIIYFSSRFTIPCTLTANLTRDRFLGR